MSYGARGLKLRISTLYDVISNTQAIYFHFDYFFFVCFTSQINNPDIQ